jgi:hypothetical protein
LTYTRYISTVKKMSAILFLSIYLFYTTGFHELLKVNVVIEHFYETKKIDHTVTFLHFLVMHYITDDFNDKDDCRDKQLPFKSTETYFTNPLVLYTPVQHVQLITTQSFKVNKAELNVTKGCFAITKYKTPVWNPPKNS